MADDKTALLAEAVGEGERDEDARPSRAIDVESGEARPESLFLGWSFVMCIYLLVFHQCVKVLDDEGLWGERESSPLQPFRIISLEIGIPMFFSVSGRLLALEPTTSVATWVGRTLLRIALPGCVLLGLFAVPTQLLLHGTNDFLSEAKGLWQQLIDPSSVSPVQGWLWLLPALAAIETVNAPLLLFAETHNAAWALVVICTWAIIAFLLNVVFEFSVLTCCFMVGGPAVALLIGSFVSFPKERELKSWRPADWIAIYVFSVGVVVSQMLVVLSFRYQDIPSHSKAIPAILAMTGMHFHGYFLQRWSPCIEDADPDTTPGYSNLTVMCSNNKAACSAKLEKCLPVDVMYRVARMSNFFIPAVAIISLSVGLPRSGYEYELFPMYSADGLSSIPTTSAESLVYLAPAHVAGTWCFVHMFTGWMKAYTPDSSSLSIYRKATSSSLVVWIFHYVFLAASLRVMQAFGAFSSSGADLWQALGLAFTFVVALGGSWLTFAFLQSLCPSCVASLFGVRIWTSESTGDL
mmetsp:Transcript_31634/g.73838  ORF Transcript_31634/g.73838 Transcript_31634/m.73838 type:complete len:522 (+) Transcript_31634:71-1636(+)